MNKKLLIRKIHRYIGLIIALQLLAWTLGGIWFAWNDINKIRGNHLRELTPLDYTENLVSTQNAINSISDFKLLTAINVITIVDDIVYRVDYIAQDEAKNVALIDAKTGRYYPEIDKQKAIAMVKSSVSFDAQIKYVELITSTGSHHEYRKKPLPAWAVTFDYSESPTFYVSKQLGSVTAVRHTSWRIFDVLWMLHTMDYQTRDDFGNWLIKLFSIIALITAISGIVLFIISSRKIKKR